MPSEPKRPIEELLEASARARHAEFGAEPQMPNPMRARLHEEIARASREEEPAQRRSWLSIFWPQLSLATAVTAVLVTASVFWFRSEPKESEMQLAMRAPAAAPSDAAAPLQSFNNEPQIADAKTESETARVLEQPAAMTDLLAKNGAVESAEISRADEPAVDAVKSLTEGAIAAAPPVAASAPAPSEMRREESGRAPAATARSFAQVPQSRAANATQRFSQMPASQIGGGGVKAQPRANILNNFDVQQDGDRIRVVDEDGSTYTGKLEAVARAETKALAAKEEKAAVAARAAKRQSFGEDQTEEFKFRAEGFNGSLKKRVVFEGNYIASPPEEAKPGAKSKDRSQAPARVTGTARVPGEPPIEVDAVSVAR